MENSKRTQNLSKEELKKVLATARGDQKPDLLIKNVGLLDLVNGEVLNTNVAICESSIAGFGKDYIEGKEVIDGTGKFIVPGFIDAHLHIESSLMHPFEFERLTLPRGTTTLICDPHEITNVMGNRGFEWFLRCSEMLEQNMFVQVSSCIPSLPGFETNGKPFDLEDMKKYKGHPNVLGLAEMMNFPGVINGDDEVLDKIIEFQDMHLDGHCPLLMGKRLNAYIAAGIKNCHETILKEEGKEKLQKGMSLILREGSVAKNLKTLGPLVTEFNSPQCMLCTDDRNPYEIFHSGHINDMVKMMIQDLKIPVHVAYRLSSFSAAQHFKLKRLGLIAPGKKADFLLMSDLEKVEIESVYIAGKKVVEQDYAKEVSFKFNKSIPPLENTIQRDELKVDEIKFELSPGLYNVIKIIPEEIITEHLKVNYDGKKFDQEDVLKIAVIERYGNNFKPALGLVKGTGLTGNGAIAASVAHDAHNIIVIGSDEENMVVAVNSLIESGGGFVSVQDQQISALLELPIAGLISVLNAEKIVEKMKDLKVANKKMNICLESPYLQMAFLALPVIPSLKITDKGLVDVTKFSFVGLNCETT
jgi:adenine deaminase